MIAISRPQNRLQSRHLDEQEGRAFLNELSQHHKHIAALVEQAQQYANYVDPREPYMDDGEEWRAIGIGSGGTNRPAYDFAGFANEQELTEARELCRRMLTYSEFVQNGHEVRENYAVDTGFVFKAVPKQPTDVAKAKAKKLQGFLDDIVRLNRWPFMQRERVRRRDRDGEAFLRRFRRQDGMTLFRFVEPWQVGNPPDANRDTTQFGIECEPDDAMSVVTYHVQQDATGQRFDPVPAEEIQHVKGKVDSNVRRGVPLFWVARQNVHRSFEGLRNIAQKSVVAAAMCVVRSHRNATGTAVQTFQTSNATSSRVDPLTGSTSYTKKYGPGTFLDKSANTDYETLNIAEGIEEMIMGSEAGLRALAAAAGLPEFMLTCNAANANYSSTMVAEGPAVRTFRAIQSMLKENDLELLDDAVDWAVEKGLLDADILDEVEIQVEPPQLATRDLAAEANANKTYLDARITSPQTLSSKLGLDYDQEQENIASHEKEHPAPKPVVDPNAPAMRGAMRGVAESELHALILKDYQSLSESADGGKWVTISGNHVYIDKGGKITKGPKSMIGQSPKELSGDKSNADNYKLEPLNAETDAEPTHAKSDKAAAILDSWTTPARGSREGDYSKARSNMETWVKGRADKGMDDLYAETQAGLKSRGIKTEKIFRGVALPVDHPIAKAIAAGTVGVNSQLLLEGAVVASWSDSAPAAHSFAQSHKLEAGASGKEAFGVVLERVVDAGDVIASHRVHRGFLAGEGEYIARNTGKMKVRVTAITKPYGLKESEKPDEAQEFDISECDDQRGIEKPKE